MFLFQPRVYLYARFLGFLRSLDNSIVSVLSFLFLYDLL